MARYTAVVETDKPRAEVFADLSDLTRFAEWDPGVTAAVLVGGIGGSLGAAYDLTVKVGRRESVMRYEITELVPPRRLKIVGTTSLFTSIDVITVGAAGSRTVIEYDALLLLPKMLRFLDARLARAFDRIGDRAATGLAEFVAGHRARA